MKKGIEVSLKDCKGLLCDWAIQKEDINIAITVIKRIMADNDIITSVFLTMVGLAKFYNEGNEKVFKQLDKYYEEQRLITSTHTINI